MEISDNIGSDSALKYSDIWVVGFVVKLVIYLSHVYNIHTYYT